MEKLITKAEFNEWWDSENLSANNPYRLESAAYWAWEGWQAGVKAEREACVKLCDHRSDFFAAFAIKERGAP